MNKQKTDVFSEKLNEKKVKEMCKKFEVFKLNQNTKTEQNISNSKIL